MNNSVTIRLTCLLAVLVTACERPPEQLAAVPPGAPLAGLDETSLSRMRAGEALFNRVFTPESGLGPLFNDNQCSACHTHPVTGGTGDQFIHRQSKFSETSGCDLLSEAGGENVRINATPALKALGISRQPEPQGATERTRFNVPFIFGTGLVDAIPEAQILERADPDDQNGDGISGRPGRDGKGAFARFGRKADHATLRAFVENAAHFEMGLTTPLHPAESRIGGRTLSGIDPAADPELSEEQVVLITDFVRFLSPLAQRIPDDEQADIVRGAELFQSVGCTSCHVPTMTTGSHDIKAISNKRFPLYSDLLLHDLGPDLATVCAAGATPTEMRTEPLIGLGRRSVFLHDARTNDLTEAILFHGGEAAAVRARFQALNELQKHKLIRFLQSL